MELPPVIAIHGVGHHNPDELPDLVQGTFARASLTADVTEFNWDAIVDHSLANVGDSITLLNHTAESISNAAALPLAPGPRAVDRLASWLSDEIYHSVFRPLVAIGLVLFIVGPVLHLLVLLPAAMFDLLSWAGFQWIRTATRVVLAAVALVIAVLSAIDVLRSLVRISTTPLWVGLRRWALLVLQPLMLLVTIPMAFRFGSGLLGMVRGMIPMAILGAVLNLLLGPLVGGFRDTSRDIGKYVLVIMAAAIVGGLHVLARTFWIDGPLKVVLDIVRYMGAPMYRRDLQRAFDSRIEALVPQERGGRNVFLLAHSLGSVIALDSLVNSPVWTKTDSVILVTMGSPIKRFFFRFFPDYLFPASIDGAARMAASRLGSFSWINVHRGLDYVGSGLGLQRHRLGTDICTGQWSKLLGAHSHYWNDDRVAGLLCRELDATTPVPATPPSPAAPVWLVPELATASAPRRIADAARFVAVGLVLMAVGSAIATFVQSRGTWRRTIANTLAVIETSGLEAQADVTYHETVEGSGEHRYLLHHFVFAIPGQPDLPSIEIPDNIVYDRHASRFDYQALAAFILDDCRRSEEKRWWQVFRRTKGIPCTRTGIRIRYDPSHPDSFIVPGFPSRGGTSTRFWEVVAMLILGIFFAAGCFMVIAVGGVSLLRLFLGLAVERAVTRPQ
jgi:hypothetical protein